MKDNYLAKWLNNELTEAELAAFKETAEYASYQRIVNASDKLQGPSYDVDKAYARLRDKTSAGGKVVQMRSSRMYWSAAAAVAVLIAFSFFYINTLDETISTAYAEQTRVNLPDESEVLLNAGSELSYSKRKWDKQRNVSLQGEAFFRVAKGKKFTVTTESGSVTVLGTQFNVEQRKGFFEVSCFEGLVSVSFNGREHRLPAGSSLMMVDGQLVTASVAPGTTPSWLNDESSFKSIPLAYVLQEFERQFDVQVETRNIDLGQLFTGTFSNTDIHLALQSISTPSQMKYTLEENNVLFYAEDIP